MHNILIQIPAKQDVLPCRSVVAGTGLLSLCGAAALYRGVWFLSSGVRLSVLKGIPASPTKICKKRCAVCTEQNSSKIGYFRSIKTSKAD